MDPQKLKSWVTGPKGGHYYVSESGKKIYGKQAEAAAKKEGAPPSPNKDPLAQLAQAKAAPPRSAENSAPPVSASSVAAQNVRIFRNKLGITAEDEQRADKVIADIKNWTPPADFFGGVKVEVEEIGGGKASTEAKFRGVEGYPAGSKLLRVSGTSHTAEIKGDWNSDMLYDQAQKYASIASRSVTEITEKNHRALAWEMYSAYKAKHAEESARYTPGSELATRPPKPNPFTGEILKEHFASVGLGKVHERQTKDWVDSSSSEGAMMLHGQLARFGIPGKMGEEEYDLKKLSEITTSRLAGQGPVDKYIKEMYLLSQASLRAQGITEIKLYRGVAAQGLIKKGTYEGIAQISTRPASSWTPRPAVAQKFAKSQADQGGGVEPFVLDQTIPAGLIYSHHGLFGNSSGEDEYVVMGMSAHRVNVERLLTYGT